MWNIGSIDDAMIQKQTKNHIQKKLAALASKKRAIISKRFFKTGKGEYSEGDMFIGVAVPDIRKLAKKYFQTIHDKDLLFFLHSPVHEERLLALIIMVYQFQQATRMKDEKTQKNLFAMYLKNTRYVNNWDLVDTSAEHIVGAFLCQTCTYQRNGIVLLSTLAHSKHLWERRIAIVATFHSIKEGQWKPTLRIARMLLRDHHDLIHKATGWMLREVGKNAGVMALESFLIRHKKSMPRTMLQYAIERLPKRRQIFWKK